MFERFKTNKDETSANTEVLAVGGVPGVGSVPQVEGVPAVGETEEYRI